jgi:hypothetical protein
MTPILLFICNNWKLFSYCKVDYKQNNEYDFPRHASSWPFVILKTTNEWMSNHYLILIIGNVKAINN